MNNCHISDTTIRTVQVGKHLDEPKHISSPACEAVQGLREPSWGEINQKALNDTGHALPESRTEDVVTRFW